MNHLVKILINDDGEEEPLHRQVWHVITDKGGDQTLCEGEFFGHGESGCVYETKTVKKGGITCPNCITFIKEVKAIKL